MVPTRTRGLETMALGCLPETVESTKLTKSVVLENTEQIARSLFRERSASSWIKLLPTS